MGFTGATMSCDLSSKPPFGRIQICIPMVQCGLAQSFAPIDQDSDVWSFWRSRPSAFTTRHILERISEPVRRNLPNYASFGARYSLMSPTCRPHGVAVYASERSLATAWSNLTSLTMSTFCLYGTVYARASPAGRTTETSAEVLFQDIISHCST